MTKHRSLWEWSCEYVGDPSSWSARGVQIVEFLKECGLTEQSRVLEIGCGNLSSGKPLIEFLAPGHFAGIEPNGWLVEIALMQFPTLEHKSPRFLWNDSFDASEFATTFDFVVSHSVASHLAHWQLPLMLTNTRAVVVDGARFLCSYRDDQYNSLSDEFRYPGHVTFRRETVQVHGFQSGWRAEPMYEWRHAMERVAPADVHDWLRLTAVDSAAAMNDLRLLEEERLRTEEVAREEAETLRRFELEEADRRAALGDAE